MTDDSSQEEKQIFLRENILEKGYDTNMFVEFLMDKKGEDGADVANWSLPDLKNVVQEFISLHNGNSNNNQQEEQNENVEKNEVNNEQNEIKQQPQQQNKKNQECSYGIVTKNEIHCMKALNNEQKVVRCM